MARPSGRDIRDETLAEATEAIRRSGVTGFSYGDLASRIGVRAPSLHHHFPTRDGLIAATVRHYRESFRTRADALEHASPLDRLAAYTELFLDTADEGVMCLCGAATVGWVALDDEARAEVAGFFSDETSRLQTLLEQAREADQLRSDADTGDLAGTVLATLEGALLIHRTGGATSARAVIETMLALLRS